MARTFGEGTFGEGTFGGDLGPDPDPPPVTGDYADIVLAGNPELYWPLNETAGTTIHDVSGHGNHGKLFSGQVVSAANHILGVPGGPAGGTAIQMLGNWSTPTVQDNPGTGIRADDFKPFQTGQNFTISGWYYKTDPLGFATMFSASGGAGGANGTPHPTLEWGIWPNDQHNQMARFYATVNTYFVGFVDWGTPHGRPDNDFALDSWHHVAFTFNDATGISELYVNGVSQGTNGPATFAGGPPSHWDTVADPGTFQVGWRGGAPWTEPPGNTEVWGGLMQHVAVYSRVLAPEEIVTHGTASPSEGFRLTSPALLGLVAPDEGDPQDPLDDVAGTVVSVYLRSVAVPQHGGPPAGAPVTTATVQDDGSVTFIGLTDYVPYLGYANVNDQDIWVTFTPPNGNGPN